MKEKMIPEIRFKGFTDTWEQRKLIDNAEKVLDYRGKSPTKFGMEWGNEGYLVLSALNVKNGYIDKSIEAKYGSPELFERWMGDNRLVKGDVLFTTEAPLGNVAQVPDNKGYILNQRAVAFKASKVTDNNFFAQLLRSPIIQNILNSNSSGGTAKGIGMKEFAKISAHVPKLEEQQKIGLFFKQLDETITLQERKLDLLKEQKKGYLQKMFPKQNEKFPELRFEGYTDAWEQRKLGDISQIMSGGTPSTSTPEFWNGDIDWYSPVEIGEQIFVNGSQKKITELGLQKSSAKILPVGTILFTSRAGIGNTAILAKEGCTNQGFQSIVPGYELDSYFIFSRTNELKRYGETNGAGSTFTEISGKQMAKMPILIPKMAEQKKIGAFFKSLDDTIALQEHKVEQMKEMKKGFLQKLFV